MKKLVNYLQESYDELVYKVSWPSLSEVTNSAVVVLFASLAMSLVVWAMDSVFEYVMHSIYKIL